MDVIAKEYFLSTNSLFSIKKIKQFKKMYIQYLLQINKENTNKPLQNRIKPYTLFFLVPSPKQIYLFIILRVIGHVKKSLFAKNKGLLLSKSCL